MVSWVAERGTEDLEGAWLDHGHQIEPLGEHHAQQHVGREGPLVAVNVDLAAAQGQIS
jgi:hypothetical protein